MRYKISSRSTSEDVFSWVWFGFADNIDFKAHNWRCLDWHFCQKSMRLHRNILYAMYILVTLVFLGGFTFRQCKNKCYVNHSNCAFVYNFKLSIITQHSNEKCCQIEDSNSIGQVHQRSAFCFGSHGDMTFFSRIFMDLQTATHVIFFLNKNEPQKVFILMFVHQLWVAVRQGRPQPTPNIWHMVECRILF